MSAAEDLRHLEQSRPLPALGTRATLTRTITTEDVERFAQISGDTNPVHLDADYAAGTRFGRRIVHGMLVAGMISAVLGTELPGLGSIYLGQQLKFVAPVYHGDTVTTTVEVVNVRPDKRIVTLSTLCSNQHGDDVIVGEAVVMCP